MTVHTDTELTNSEWYNQELANKNSHRTHLVIKKRKRCNLVFFFFWEKIPFQQRWTVAQDFKENDTDWAHGFLSSWSAVQDLALDTSRNSQLIWTQQELEDHSMHREFHRTTSLISSSHQCLAAQLTWDLGRKTAPGRLQESPQR